MFSVLGIYDRKKYLKLVNLARFHTILMLLFPSAVTANYAPVKVTQRPSSTGANLGNSKESDVLGSVECGKLIYHPKSLPNLTHVNIVFNSP